MGQITIPPMIPLDKLREMNQKEKNSGNAGNAAGTGSISNREESINKTAAVKKEEPYKLFCVSGVYEDASFPLDAPITLGRATGEVQILYPADTRGISRKHCRIEIDNCGNVILKDLESSAGTYLGDGTKLEPWRKM